MSGKVFDALYAIPNVSPLLPELEFEISIPDEIISRINIDKVEHQDALTGS